MAFEVPRVCGVPKVACGVTRMARGDSTVACGVSRIACAAGTDRSGVSTPDTAESTLGQPPLANFGLKLVVC